MREKEELRPSRVPASVAGDLTRSDLVDMAFSASHSSVMRSVALGVISNARGRQRRRYLSTAAALLACAGVGAGFIASHTQSPLSLPPQAGVATRVAPAAVLAQTPSMGVACLTRACDAVGLAVWLRQSAMHVSATIAGHRLDLSTRAAHPYLPPTRHRNGTMLVGYLTPLRAITPLQLTTTAPTMWASESSPDPLVRLRIDYRSGRVLLTQLRIPIQPGWG
jgi:hypothetical protein